jgi:hypothetical protein
MLQRDFGIKEEDAAWEDEEDLDVDHVPRSETCCMRQVLALQDDFRREKSMIQKFIEERGHNCYFLPKYHREFNPIDIYWAWVKRREFFIHAMPSLSIYLHLGFRCLADGTFQTAKVLLPEILDSCPVKTIRAFFCKTWRYMDGYRYVSLY